MLVPVHSWGTITGPDLYCIAEAVNREARGESLLGKRAVIQTVINRTKSSRYPKTACGVVFQDRQFSWTRTMQRWTYTENDIKTVQNFQPMNSFKATHFHNLQVNPGWKLRYIKTIGSHKFYY